MASDYGALTLDIEELKDLKLTGPQLRFVMAYLSPQCYFDSRKALRVITPDDEFEKLSKPAFYARARGMMSKPDVATAITRLMTKEVEQKKEEIIPLLVNDLMIAASYDPAEIIDDDGDFKHGTLSMVPIHLRKSVVESVQTKYWGKDCNVRTREVKMVSKSKSRSQLIDFMRVVAQIEAKTEDNKPAQFIVNIGSTPIEGMATADELFKMASTPIEGQATKVEEDGNDS